MDAVPTLERAKEILAPAKRAPRARSADMAMVDMLRWTERSRGRRWCAPMRLSGGEARLLEWPRNVIGKKLRRNAWRNLSSAGPSLQILSQSPYGRNTCYEVCAKVVTMCLLAKYPFITVNTLITQVTDSRGKKTLDGTELSLTTVRRGDAAKEEGSGQEGQGCRKARLLNRRGALRAVRSLRQRHRDDTAGHFVHGARREIRRLGRRQRECARAGQISERSRGADREPGGIRLW